MNYNLIRPCAKCPFRNDITPYLRADRAEEIIDGLRCGAEFACHQTTFASDDEDGEDEDEMCIDDGTTEVCAGSLILMEREGVTSQMMRISERLTNPKTGKRYYDPTRLDMKAPVYDDFDQMLDAYTEEQDCLESRARFAKRKSKRKIGG